MRSPLRALVPAVLAAVTAPAISTLAQPAPAPAPQAIIADAVGRAVAEFKDHGLTPEQITATLLVLDGRQTGAGNVRGDVPVYPASVVKLFYLVAAEAWLEKGQIQDTPELERALRDMIVDSSNDATSYVVDVLTGTTSGPELPDEELRQWFDRRNAINRYFAELGYTGINVNKKPWGDGPYGRETQAARQFEAKRNQLTANATARLLAAIATGRAVTPARSKAMMDLLYRHAEHPDEQAQFISSALPAGARQWSKAGWTSETRHVAAYVELPNGTKFVLAVFTVGHASDTGILATVTRAVVEQLNKS